MACRIGFGIWLGCLLGATTGKAAGNREVGLMSEIARNRFVHLTDNEVEAIQDYLVEVARRDP